MAGVAEGGAQVLHVQLGAAAGEGNLGAAHRDVHRRNRNRLPSRAVTDRSGRLAIVPPRFGDDVIGGAEAALREAAEGLAERGWEVDVLTTCARDHFTWANEYPEGEEQVGKLRVRAVPDRARHAPGRAGRASTPPSCAASRCRSSCRSGG